MHGVSGGFLALVLAMPLDAQVTESPFTVAPGRVLVEMDGLRFAVDRDSGSRFTGLAVASTLLSAGITSYLDVQAGVDLFLKETYRVGGRFRVTKNIELDYELQRGVSSRSTDWTHVLRVNWEW
jgi:hypothetical protein